MCYLRVAGTAGLNYRQPCWRKRNSLPCVLGEVGLVRRRTTATMASFCPGCIFCMLWLILLLFPVWMIAFFVGWLYIFVLPFAGCISALESVAEALLTVVQLPFKLGQNIAECKGCRDWSPRLCLRVCSGDVRLNAIPLPLLVVFTAALAKTRACCTFSAYDRFCCLQSVPADPVSRRHLLIIHFTSQKSRPTFRLFFSVLV